MVPPCDAPRPPGDGEFIGRSEGRPTHIERQRFVSRPFGLIDSSGTRGPVPEVACRRGDECSASKPIGSRYRVPSLPLACTIRPWLPDEGPGVVGAPRTLDRSYRNPIP